MESFKKITPAISEFYKEVDGVKLPIDVYFPKKDTDNHKTVLCIHGGGWTEGITDNSEWNGGWMGNNAKYLTQFGFTAITISYRSLRLKKKLTVPDLLEDCIDAVKFIRKRYDFVNFNEIIYMGDSVGAYFAVMLGLSQDYSIRPKLVVAANPVLNVLDKKWSYGFKGVEDMDRYMPINYIGDKNPDFLLLHGTDDTVVDIECTEKFYDALKKIGCKSNFVRLNGKEHAFILFDYKSADESVAEIMDKVINYINAE